MTPGGRGPRATGGDDRVHLGDAVRSYLRRLQPTLARLKPDSMGDLSASPSRLVPDDAFSPQYQTCPGIGLYFIPACALPGNGSQMYYYFKSIYCMCITWWICVALTSIWQLEKVCVCVCACVFIRWGFLFFFPPPSHTNTSYVDTRWPCCEGAGAVWLQIIHRALGRLCVRVDRLSGDVGLVLS